MAGFQHQGSTLWVPGSAFNVPGTPFNLYGLHPNTETSSFRGEVYPPPAGFEVGNKIEFR